MRRPGRYLTSIRSFYYLCIGLVALSFVVLSRQDRHIQLPQHPQLLSQDLCLAHRLALHIPSVAFNVFPQNFNLVSLDIQEKLLYIFSCEGRKKKNGMKQQLCIKASRELLRSTKGSVSLVFTLSLSLPFSKHSTCTTNVEIYFFGDLNSNQASK